MPEFVKFRELIVNANNINYVRYHKELHPEPKSTVYRVMIGFVNMDEIECLCVTQAELQNLLYDLELGVINEEDL